MGHLRKTARLNFKFFRDCGLIPEHKPETENYADVMMTMTVIGFIRGFGGGTPPSQFLSFL